MPERPNHPIDSSMTDIMTRMSRLRVVRLVIAYRLTFNDYKNNKHSAICNPKTQKKEEVTKKYFSHPLFVS